jgi:hypothetical protein
MFGGWFSDLFSSKPVQDVKYCYILFGAKEQVDDPDKTYPIAVFDSYELALREQLKLNNSNDSLHGQYIIPCQFNKVQVIQELLYGNM